MTVCLLANQGIATEAFDDETVLIDVEKGLYFSLRGSAVELWQAFDVGREAGQVLDAMVQSMPAADVDALQRVLQQMKDNGLLLEMPAVDGVPVPPGWACSNFQPPVLEVYSDLAELIAIDPVHEVNAALGWPIRPQGFPDAL